MASDAVQDLVADIYGAALDSVRWPSVLNRVGDAVRGPVVVYGLYDPANSIAHLHAPRVDPEIVRSFDAWVPHAPALPCIGNAPPGRVFSGTDVVAPDDFVRTEFYHECWRPAGLCTAPLVTNVLSGGAASGHLAVHTGPSRDPFDGQERRLFETLAQHMVRATAIQQRLQHLALASKSALSGFDELKHGCVVVDAKARPIFINRMAQALLESGDGLRLEAGALSASLPENARALRALIAGCADGVSLTPGGKLALARKPGRVPLEALVAPVQAEATESWFRGSPRRQANAIVLVSDPEAELKGRIDHMREQFGLTPAEAVFAFEIAKGDGRKAAAERLAITVGTARSHLSSIFAKVGVRHQAELVRLLLQK